MGELNLERSNVKFDLWERKLLDLSTRNSLLNLRIKGSAIPVFVPGCNDIEDLIAQDKNFSIISRGNDEEEPEAEPVAAVEPATEETKVEEAPIEAPSEDKPAEEAVTEAAVSEAPAPAEEPARIIQSKISAIFLNSRNTSIRNMRRAYLSLHLLMQFSIRTLRPSTEARSLQWKRTAPILCSSHADF